MSNCCSICASKNRQQIDILITSGASNRAISRQFPEFSKDAIRRHKPHISDKLKNAKDNKDISEGLELNSVLSETVKELRDLAKAAKKDKDYRAAASALGHVLKAAEILGRGNEGKPPESQQKDSGFFKSYTKRAGEVYESPPS